MVGSLQSLPPQRKLDIKGICSYINCHRGYMLLFIGELMMSEEANILVSGATGRTGGAAIDELLKMGHKVRAYVRSNDDRAEALRSWGVEIAVGDFTDIDQIRSAMEGIKSAYFLHPITPGILGAAAYFAQAAKEAGVTSIVNMSQISARRESTSHAAQDHWISERVFDWSPSGLYVHTTRRKSGPRRRSSSRSRTVAMRRSAPMTRAA